MNIECTLKSIMPDYATYIQVVWYISYATKKRFYMFLRIIFSGFCLVSKATNI